MEATLASLMTSGCGLSSSAVALGDVSSGVVGEGAMARNYVVLRVSNPCSYHISNLDTV